jgi:hypothetical protein
VVQVFTRRGEGAFQPYAGVGAGTYNTYQVNAGFSGSQAQWDYALGATKEKSQGFNVKQSNNPDSDGYDIRFITLLVRPACLCDCVPHALSTSPNPTRAKPCSSLARCKPATFMPGLLPIR